MRVQAYIFYGTAVFFFIVDIVYWLTSHDWTGTTALGFTVLLALLIGYYAHFTIRRVEREIGGRQPEDDVEGEISQGAGEIGFYSPHSWWPLFTAASAALAAFGFVIGWWLFMIGAACVLLSVIGMVFEYYRGHFAH